MAEVNASKSRVRKKRRHPSARLPVAFIAAVAALVLGASLTVFGSAFVVNEMKESLVQAASEQAREVAEEACAQISLLVGESADQPFNEALLQPGVLRQLQIIRDEAEGSITRVEIIDAKNSVLMMQQTVRKEFPGADPALPVLYDPKDHVRPRASPMEEGAIYVKQPIMRGGKQIGSMQLTVSRARALRTIEMLSERISSSLLIMVVVVLVGLIASIVLVYQVLIRHMQLQQRAAETGHMADMGALASGLAHEIRNPLHAMNLHLEVAKEDLEEARDGEKPTEALATITRVQQQIERLNGIVSNFLSLSMPSKLDLREMRLDQLTREVANFLQPQLRSRGIDVEVNLPNEMLIDGDQRALHQVLLNILINAQQALENTDVKRIEIHSEWNERKWRLFIEDSGPGIPQGEEAVIFKAFVSKRAGGTGIGLSIAKHIMEGHDGAITAGKSTMGGAMFVLEFPDRADGEKRGMGNE
ncbi:hypothetical protein BH09SUM1_BH09SUM1_15830 [soil metagenome]